MNLASGDTITIQLPPGLFSKAPTVNNAVAAGPAGSGLIHSDPKTVDKYILTVPGGGNSLTAGSIIITITGLALNDAAKYASTKIVTAFTSKESNPSTLGAISGVM